MQLSYKQLRYEILSRCSGNFATIGALIGLVESTGDVNKFDYIINMVNELEMEGFLKKDRGFYIYQSPPCYVIGIFHGVVYNPVPVKLYPTMDRIEYDYVKDGKKYVGDYFSPVTIGYTSLYPFKNPVDAEIAKDALVYLSQTIKDLGLV